MSSSIAICDVCGCKAFWAIDAKGDVWNLCQNSECDTHVQEELFPEEPDWDEGVTLRVRGSAPGDPIKSSPFTEST